MSNKERILEFLRSVGPSGATNSEIVSGTGIKPHPQVFKLTRKLFEAGVIRGLKGDPEWRFWLSKDGIARSSSITTISADPVLQLRGRLTPSEFEILAQQVMGEYFSSTLRAGKADGVPKLFDLISQDQQIVGDAKYYTLVNGVGLPPAKFSVIAEHVWLLERTRATTKFLVFGNDIRVPEMWLKRYGKLVGGIAFFFLTDEGSLQSLVNG
jgi:hypothetical protein